MDISGFLKYYQKKNSYTQEYVASKLNISRQAISAWENNQACPDIENLLLLSRLYKISLDDLVGNKADTENRKIPQSAYFLFSDAINGSEEMMPELKGILYIF